MVAQRTRLFQSYSTAILNRLVPRFYGREIEHVEGTPGVYLLDPNAKEHHFCSCWPEPVLRFRETRKHSPWLDSCLPVIALHYEHGTWIFSGQLAPSAMYSNSSIGFFKFSCIGNWVTKSQTAQLEPWLCCLLACDLGNAAHLSPPQLSHL